MSTHYICFYTEIRKISIVLVKYNAFSGAISLFKLQIQITPLPSQNTKL